jgi:hypothetical protein
MNVSDLKNIVDNLVKQGKGDLPVTTFANNHHNRVGESCVAGLVDIHNSNNNIPALIIGNFQGVTNLSNATITETLKVEDNVESDKKSFTRILERSLRDKKNLEHYCKQVVGELEARCRMAVEDIGKIIEPVLVKSCESVGKRYYEKYNGRTYETVIGAIGMFTSRHKSHFTAPLEVKLCNEVTVRSGPSHDIFDEVKVPYLGHYIVVTEGISFLTNIEGDIVRVVDNDGLVILGTYEDAEKVDMVFTDESGERVSIYAEHNKRDLRKITE